MQQPISVIALPLPLGMGSVNCYLLHAGEGFVLIDTGAPSARDLLQKRLQGLGCTPGRLSLILITHGDFDHTGNAAYIRAGWRSQIAMHLADSRMAEVGDMFINRRTSNLILKTLIPRLIGFGSAERFAADILVEDGALLSDYGLEARIVAIPGHSPGSIGLLCADGSFFCGDLFDNTKGPALNSILDDRDAAIRSTARLSSLKITTVYPGHGKPFLMDRMSVTLHQADRGR